SFGCFFFFSSRRRHTRFDCDWSSDVCSSDLPVCSVNGGGGGGGGGGFRALFSHVCVKGGGGEEGEEEKKSSECVGEIKTVTTLEDRKSVVEGKSVGLGGRRSRKRKKEVR